MPPTRLGVGPGVRVGQTSPYAVPLPVPVPLPLPLATNQTAGRSPFIATSSLAELYRRSVPPLYLPCISLHLPYISSYLAYISPISRHISPVPGLGKQQAQRVRWQRGHRHVTFAQPSE